MLLELEKAIQELQVLPCAQADEKRYTSDGGGLRQLLETAGVTSENLLGVVELCSKGTKLMGETARLGVSANRQCHLAQLAEMLNLAFDTSSAQDHYRLCVQELPEKQFSPEFALKRARPAAAADQPPPRQLGYWCFSAGVAMRGMLEQGVRSLLLTSGTLSPLNSFAQEMGVPFQHVLENPHVIKPSQLLVSDLPTRLSYDPWPDTLATHLTTPPHHPSSPHTSPPLLTTPPHHTSHHPYSPPLLPTPSPPPHRPSSPGRRLPDGAIWRRAHLDLQAPLLACLPGRPRQRAGQFRPHRAAGPARLLSLVRRAQGVLRRVGSARRGRHAISPRTDP